jgi:hypothetical protein
MPGHGRLDGVALLAYDPGIHPLRKKLDCRVKPGNDERELHAQPKKE